MYLQIDQKKNYILFFWNIKSLSVLFPNDLVLEKKGEFMCVTLCAYNVQCSKKHIEVTKC